MVWHNPHYLVAQECKLLCNSISSNFLTSTIDKTEPHKTLAITPLYIENFSKEQAKRWPVFEPFSIQNDISILLSYCRWEDNIVLCSF